MKGNKPLLLYFNTKKDREWFIEKAQAARPGMISKAVEI